MNEKFYALSKEKQDRIINAGFRVFSKNSYKKSPVQEIALEAGISKSLLFFYFRNKKDLYLFLWKKVEEITTAALSESKCSEADDIFDVMYKGIVVAKLGMLKDYPDILNFTVKSYYEDDPEVRDDIRKLAEPYTRLETNTVFPKLDPKDFKEGLDLEMMYRDMYLASEGYLWQVSQSGNINVDKVVKDYRDMIDFWKKMYLR